MKTHHKNSERLVNKVFQDVFDKYDLMNDLMSLGIHRLWKKNFIHWLNPQKNTTLIDVASGTGDIAKLYLDKVQYKGSVYCVDENKGMLDLNKKKLEESSNAKWGRTHVVEDNQGLSPSTCAANVIIETMSPQISCFLSLITTLSVSIKPFSIRISLASVLITT